MNYSRNKIKRITPVIIITLLLLCALTGGASAFSGSGSGTASDPYQIATPEQLQEMNDDVTAYYKLMSDIDCSSLSSWTPIGSTNSFTGQLDGNNKTIKNLTYNKTEDGAGIFKVLGNSCVIKDCVFDNIIITNTESEVGIISSEIDANATVELTDITVKNSQSQGKSKTGGLISVANSGSSVTFTNCNVINTNVNSTSARYGGGLISYIDSGNTFTFNNCMIDSCTINAIAYIGGFIGGISATSVTFDANCVCKNSLIKNGIDAGGFIGYIDETILSISRNSSEGNGAKIVNCCIQSNNNRSGGIIGHHYTNSSNTNYVDGIVVDHCSIYGKYCGGIIGLAATTTLYEINSPTISNSTITGINTAAGISPAESSTILTQLGEVSDCNIYATTTYDIGGTSTGTTTSNITHEANTNMNADSSGISSFDVGNMKLTLQVTHNSGINGIEGAVSSCTCVHEYNSTSYNDTVTLDNTGKVEIDWTGRKGGLYTTTMTLTNYFTSKTVSFTTNITLPPTIEKLEITNPTGRTAYYTNENITYTVTATGEGTLSYAWYIDGEMKSSSDSSYTQQYTAGTHTIKVEVSNSSVTSSKTETLTVYEHLEVTAVTSTPIVPNGIDIKFDCTPTGGAITSPSDYTYTWYQSMGIVIPPIEIATTKNPTLTLSLPNGDYEFYVKVKDLAGQEETSNTITVKIVMPPSINDFSITNPSGTTFYYETDDITYTVTATTYYGTLSYKWFVDNVEVSGETSSNFTHKYPAGNYEIKIEVTNIAGTIQETKSLRTYSLPSVTASTTTQIVLPTKEISLSSTATGGAGTLTYAWYKDNESTIISTEQNPTITAPSTVGTYKYKVVVTDEGGKQATSNEVNVTVSVDLVATATITEMQLGSSIASTTLVVNSPTGSVVQWYDGTTAISGATTKSYVWTPATEGIHNVKAGVTIASVEYFSNNLIINVYGTYTVNTFETDETIIYTDSNANITSSLTTPALIKSDTEIKLQKTNISTPAETDWIDVKTITDPSYDEYEVDGATYGTGVWNFRLHYGESTFGYKNSNTISISIVDTLSITSISVTPTVGTDDLTYTMICGVNGGIPLLTYAWYSKSNNETIWRSIGTGATLNKTFAKGIYHLKCVVTDNKLTVKDSYDDYDTFKNVTVNVGPLPMISDVSVSPSYGDLTNILSLSATVQYATSMQWEMEKPDGTIVQLTGATSPTFVYDFSESVSGIYKFRLKATNTGETITSSDVTYSASMAPIINSVSTNPTHISKAQTITLQSDVNEKGLTTTYQWYIKPPNSTTYIEIPGAILSTYLYAFAYSEEGTYYFKLKASNIAGITESTDVKFYFGNTPANGASQNGQSAFLLMILAPLIMAGALVLGIVTGKLQGKAIIVALIAIGAALIALYLMMIVAGMFDGLSVESWIK